MKHILLSATLLLLTSLLAAQAPESGLTKKEAAEGWLALFDGKTTYGWSQDKPETWKVEKGELVASEDKEGTLISTTPFASFSLVIEYFVDVNGKLEVLVQTDEKGAVKHNGQRHKSNWKACWAQLTLKVDARGAIRNMTSLALTGIDKGKGIASVVKDGQGQPRSGYVALKGQNVRIRSIKLKPETMESIFNGKDLSGWKIFPDRKSKFTVTDAGELHVVDGNGDLQTEKQWDDFVLQLECKTNGEHLNSGIFFRCLPDEYQQGYEAQIHNGFTEKPEKTYTLDVYPPIEHERGVAKAIKKGEHEPKKIQVKSTAMDFGTGAIYRRALARMQVAKDKEWFTFTVVAHGQHFSTWVDGIQVCDWTDNRPLDDNPRKGCRLKAGAISIQGHDPTTDLLFRNFRISALPIIPKK